MARAMIHATHPLSAMPLLRARRVVVKVGSALLVDPQTGAANRAWLETLAADVATMRGRGQEVLLVSSGAIALGRRQLGLSFRAAQAGREAGGGGGRPDPAGARLEGCAGAA